MIPNWPLTGLDPDATSGFSVVAMELGTENPVPAWKVGALATLSGITVRTLHHYDRIAC